MKNKTVFLWVVRQWPSSEKGKDSDGETDEYQNFVFAKNAAEAVSKSEDLGYHYLEVHCVCPQEEIIK
jgi:hypothetical protein